MVPTPKIKQAIKITRNIAEIFADRQVFGDDPFRFTQTKQRSLGQMFVKRLDNNGSSYAEFNAAPMYQFATKVMESKLNNGDLYQDVSRMLDSIRQAHSLRDLEGKERLVAIQNQLVELTNYIESKEGFTVSNENRKKVKLVGQKVIVEESTMPQEIRNLTIGWLTLPELPSFLTPTPPAVEQTEINFFQEPQVIHSIPGRIRVKLPPSISDEKAFQKLESLLKPIPGVESIGLNQSASSMTVYYDDHISQQEFTKLLLEKLEQVNSLTVVNDIN